MVKHFQAETNFVTLELQQQFSKLEKYDIEANTIGKR